jgi:outer membrane protein assembly factor BamA
MTRKILTRKSVSTIGSILALISSGALAYSPSASAQLSPSCEAIYKSTPVIEEIEVDRGSVFTDEDPLPKWLPIETVNKFHKLSQEHLITQELLFKTGEPLDQYRIEETLRNLRSLGILQQEEIRCESRPGNRVMVKVSTRDAWSLEPILNLAVLNAGTTWSLGFREFNLMGLGKQLRTSYSDHFGDSQLSAAYFDPRIAGSRWRWSVSGLTFDSGESASFALGHPFYSLETQWGGGMTLNHFHGNEILINDGIITNEFSARRRNLQIDAAYAVNPSSSAANRVGLFYRYAEREFTPVESSITSPPDNRTEAPLGLLYRRIAADYITENHVAHFDRPEYFNLGNDLSATIGYSAPTFGADKDEILFSLNDAQGYTFREGHFIQGGISAAGRLHRGRVENFGGGIRLQWFLRETKLDSKVLKHTFVVDTNFFATERQDNDRFLSLGESTGLRGYRNHVITGDRRLRVTFEDRLFNDRRVAGLLTFGGVIFADTGYVWEKNESFDLGDLATGVGIGLRIAWPASATEQVIRIDLAWPLSSVPQDDGNPKFMLVTATEF